MCESHARCDVCDSPPCDSLTSHSSKVRIPSRGQEVRVSRAALHAVQLEYTHSHVVRCVATVPVAPAGDRAESTPLECRRLLHAQAARELVSEDAAPLELRVRHDQRRAAPHKPRARARDGNGELLVVEQVCRDGDVDTLGQYGLLVEQVEDACMGSKTGKMGSSRAVGSEERG